MGAAADGSRSRSPDGSADWPCSSAALSAGRQFLQRAATAGGRIVLAPDKDADGLSAGASYSPRPVLLMSIVLACAADRVCGGSLAPHESMHRYTRCRRAAHRLPLIVIRPCCVCPVALHPAVRLTPPTC